MLFKKGVANVVFVNYLVIVYRYLMLSISYKTRRRLGVKDCFPLGIVSREGGLEATLSFKMTSVLLIYARICPGMPEICPRPRNG